MCGHFVIMRSVTEPYKPSMPIEAVLMAIEATLMAIATTA